MKKSQRLRLTALLGKDQATLSADEKSELATLQTLATANPDPSKDTEDTPATPAAVVVTPAPGLVASLKGALSGFGDKAKLGADFAQARADLATANTTITTHVATIAARDGTIAAQAAQLATFAGFFGMPVADLAGKDATALAAVLAQKVSAHAVEALAGAGVPQSTLPALIPADPKPSAKSKTLTLAAFRSLSNAEKMDFSANGGRIED
jgi:hypothetical protein